MILAIESDLPSFKPVQFRPGLNVLLAEKSPDSDRRQTRNSAGKSSLIEIIHWLLGGKGDKDALPRNAALVDATFYGTFRLGELEVQVARSGAEPGRIILTDPEWIARLGIATRTDKKTGATSISIDAWRDVLGHFMFGLPLFRQGTAYEPSFTPTFRSLISYFARRRGSGAFTNPYKQAEQQRPWDSQVNLSFLLGLDWEVPRGIQLVRETERQLEELKKAARGGAIGEVIGTVAELRPKLVLAEDRAGRLKRDLAAFRVVGSYREQSTEAAQLRSEMLHIERQAVAQKETLAHLRNSLGQEQPAEQGNVGLLYAALQIELPEVVARRFEEVAAFHRSVVENRRVHLQAEVEHVESEIRMGEQRTAQLDARRSEILRFLQDGGALEDFLALQKTLADLEAECAALRQRYQAAEILEGRATQLDIDRAALKLRLQADHQARREMLIDAILFIGQSIAELYKDRHGEFVVEATEAGPEFRITIQGDRGGGIANMEIFCLDLALLVLTARRGTGPKFLIHDSHLFDGVDERQIATALLLGKSVAEEIGGQYIVMMNSDMFDRLPMPDPAALAGCVLETRLSDKGEDGGLFGCRFD